MRSNDIPFFFLRLSTLIWYLVLQNAKIEGAGGQRELGYWDHEQTLSQGSLYTLTLTVGQTKLPPYESRWPPKYIGYLCVCVCVWGGVCRVLYGVEKNLFKNLNDFKKKKYRTSNLESSKWMCLWRQKSKNSTQETKQEQNRLHSK